MAAGTALLGGVALAAPARASATTHYLSYTHCTALNARYHHGVGRSGAADHVRGSTKPVATFYRNTGLYLADERLDRDHDGIACEKR